MRDYKLEQWLRGRLLENIGPPGNHGHGWSWIGNCAGSYILSKFYPEIKEQELKGNMYPGTMLHEFMQKWVFPDGLKAIGLEILAHEQEVFIPMKNEPFRMSPIDTLVYDHNNNCFGVIDYKSAKKLNWVKTDAKKANREQVNLYAHVFGAEWFMIIYVDKKNYDKYVIHKYPVDHDLGEMSIRKLEKIDRWLYEEKYRDEIPWTELASGLNTFSNGNSPYRYICEPSVKTPSYTGCPYKKYCLKLLSKEYGTEFTSLARYDKYLRDHA